MSTLQQLGQTHAIAVLGLTKEAANKITEYLRRVMSTQLPAEQAAVARAVREGVVRPVFTSAGEGIKQLGAGGEGVADVVAHPTLGITQRKIFDPIFGLTTPAMINRKVIAGQALANDPNFARFYHAENVAPTTSTISPFKITALHPDDEYLFNMGFAPRTYQKTVGPFPAPKDLQVHYNEFIPGGHEPPPWSTANPQQTRAMRETIRRVQRAVKNKTPYQQALDVRPGNLMLDPRTRRYRSIDFLPVYKGEFRPSPAGQTNVLRITNQKLIRPKEYETAIASTPREVLYQLMGVTRATGQSPDAALRAATSMAKPFALPEELDEVIQRAATDRAAAAARQHATQPGARPEAIEKAVERARRRAAARFQRGPAPNPTLTPPAPTPVGQTANLRGSRQPMPPQSPESPGLLRRMLDFMNFSRPTST